MLVVPALVCRARVQAAVDLHPRLVLLPFCVCGGEHLHRCGPRFQVRRGGQQHPHEMAFAQRSVVPGLAGKFVPHSRGRVCVCVPRSLSLSARRPRNHGGPTCWCGRRAHPRRGRTNKAAGKGARAAVCARRVDGWRGAAMGFVRGTHQLHRKVPLWYRTIGPWLYRPMELLPPACGRVGAGASPPTRPACQGAGGAQGHGARTLRRARRGHSLA